MCMLAELPLVDFTPKNRQRKYGLVIQGPSSLSYTAASLDSTIASLAVNREYDGVILLNSGLREHQFAHETARLIQDNLFGILEEFSRELTEDDLLVVSVFGDVVDHEKHLSLPTYDHPVRVRSLVPKLQALPSHTVYYVTNAGTPGTLAHYRCDISQNDKSAHCDHLYIH